MSCTNTHTHTHTTRKERERETLSSEWRHKGDKCTRAAATAARARSPRDVARRWVVARAREILCLSLSHSRSFLKAIIFHCVPRRRKDEREREREGIRIVFISRGSVGSHVVVVALPPASERERGRDTFIWARSDLSEERERGTVAMLRARPFGGICFFNSRRGFVMNGREVEVGDGVQDVYRAVCLIRK